METFRRLNWQLIVDVAIILFLAGVGWASFQTKAEAAREKQQILEFMEVRYMPRELSLEKWVNNEKSHEDINKKLDEVLKELRSKK